MERLTKQYNESTGTYEYVDAFTGAGMFDSIIKKLSSNFAKNIGAKALEASASAIGSRVGNIAIDKIEKKFSKPTEDSKPKPLGDVIVSELSKNNSLTSSSSSKPIDLPTQKDSIDLPTQNDSINLAKIRYYGYGTLDKNFNSKLNKFLN